MSSLLIYSPKCKHCEKIFIFLESKPQLKQMVKFHNVNQLGIPQQYKEHIKSVPTLLTSNQKFLVGNEIIQFFTSLLPSEITNMDISGSGLNVSSLSGDESYDNYFELSSYGQSLQGAMTPELEAKISRNVQESYQANNR